MQINRKTAALLVMDCQINMINKQPPEDRAKLLGNIAKVINSARKSGLPIIYVVVQFRKGHPEVSTKNMHFYKQKEAGILIEGNPDGEICGEIRPQPDDVIVTKLRLSSFSGSDLEIILRSKNIDTLILSGVSTLGAVESTARQAFDMDYQLFVLSDCCADRVSGAHEAALKYVMPRISTVCSSDDLLTAISEG
jgi:nicotinamidase-related amidase